MKGFDSILYEQVSLEQSTNIPKFELIYYAVVLILDGKVHIKSIHRFKPGLKRGKFVFYSG